MSSIGSITVDGFHGDMNPGRPRPVVEGFEREGVGSGSQVWPEQGRQIEIPTTADVADAESFMDQADALIGTTITVTDQWDVAWSGVEVVDVAHSKSEVLNLFRVRSVWTFKPQPAP